MREPSIIIMIVPAAAVIMWMRIRMESAIITRPADIARGDIRTHRIHKVHRAHFPRHMAMAGIMEKQKDITEMVMDTVEDAEDSNGSF